MLWISKVTSGVATDGKAEFSLFVVDAKENVYEIHTDDSVYEQLLEVIGASLGGDDSRSIAPESEAAAWSDDNRKRLAELISNQAPQPPQHAVEGQPPSNGKASLSSVGFDFDYRAEFDSDQSADDEEEDPGEEAVDEEDEYVESL